MTVPKRQRPRPRRASGPGFPAPILTQRPGHVNFFAAAGYWADRSRAWCRPEHVCWQEVNCPNACSGDRAERDPATGIRELQGLRKPQTTWCRPLDRRGDVA
jgi:hypothetical protein